jgi:hypothetical protein
LIRRVGCITNLPSGRTIHVENHDLL